MARRTKEEAEQTRLNIIAAARKVFQAHGVTRATLQHVATAAGVTRGAIYWHFADKSALFHAMRDQVTLPLVDRGDFELLHHAETPPLARLESFINTLIDALENDQVVRETFEIMAFKCEYVGEVEPELAQTRRQHQALFDKLVQVYRQAAQEGSLRAGLKPETMASDTTMFISGLVRLWLLDEEGQFARVNVREVIAAHVQARLAWSPSS